MASKYELTISTEYVPKWTYVEAIRELFQNALDNEVVDSSNSMFFSYEDEVLKIGNKNSVLTLNTLLLGNSSKRKNDDTIGKHGEGYKVALMVLLREGKEVTIYNYGAKTVWNAKLVKSRRFNGMLVPQIFVDKQYSWTKVPDNNLTIEVKGITKEEYEQIIKSNLHLQGDISKIETGLGTILLDDVHRGKMFVNGLFICNNLKFKYGYNFKANRIKLDRDRALIDTIDTAFETSRIWGEVEDNELVSDLIMKDIYDLKYITTFRSGWTEKDSKRNDSVDSTVATKFKEKHGEDAIPVTSDESLQLAIKQGKKPVMTSDSVCNAVNNAARNSGLDVPVIKRPKQMLKDWFDGVADKLAQEDIDDFNSIYEMLSGY